MAKTFTSFAAVPVANKATRTRRKKTVSLPITLDAIAKVIDPDAWNETFQPSRQKLEIELAKAKEEIAALKDEIEWLSSAPVQERQQFREVVLIRRAGKDTVMPDDAEDQAERQRQAMKKAEEILALCKKTLGSRNTLHIVHGRKTRFIRSKGGL